MITNIVGQIDRIASSRSEQTAIICGEDRLTYGRLRSWSDAIAADLVLAGVGTDDIVPFYAGRGPAMIPALIGIMKAGAAYLPLDHRYPVERAMRLVALTNSPAHLVAGAVPVVSDHDSVRIGVVAPPPGPPVTLDARQGNFAYLVATSGSTGLPKPVLTTQVNLSNFIDGFAQTVGITAADVVLARTSLSFDPHTVETLLPLAVGATVVVLPDESCADPDAIRAAVAEHRVSVVQATPTLWRVLTSHQWHTERPLKAICGGEAMTVSLRDAILSMPGTRLWNVYGPTETTVWCSALEITAGDPPDIGPPIPGLHFEIRDANGHAIGESGEVGELYIAGAGLADGYLGSPELTSQRFIRDGRPEPHDRWYRTGDLVRSRGHGRMQFCGRADRQLKIRGYRVDLEEVENSVQACPGVRSAAVVADLAGATLVACVVSDDPALDPAVVARRVRLHLRSCLPPYLLPSRYVVVPAIPLTPTEKVDAHAILTLARAATVKAPDGGDATASGVGAVSAIWREILGTSDIDEEDEWGEVGGNSLSLIDLRARLAQATGIDIPISLLAVNPTVSGIAQLLSDDQLRIGEEVQSVPTPSGDVNLAPSQRRFFAETSAAHSHENVLELLLRTREPLPRVLDALRQIIERHDVFRISAVDPERLTQRFDARLASEIHVVPGGFGLEAFVEAAPARRSTIAVSGPLSAWWIYPTGGMTHIHACLHHLLCDELSLHILRTELALALAAPASLPTAASFREWIDDLELKAHQVRYHDLMPAWARVMDKIQLPSSMVSPIRSSGSPSKRELTLPRMTGSPSARRRRRLFLAGAIHAAGTALGLSQVGCRVVDSGRAGSGNIDDSFIIGWLAHHYPLSVRWHESAVQTAAELDAAEDSLTDRGQSYLWLRYNGNVPELHRTTQLNELPLYFNYLPELHQHQGIDDLSHLLRDWLTSTSITGFAVVVRESGEHTHVTLWRDSQRLEQHVAETFEAEFLNALTALREDGLEAHLSVGMRP